MSVHPPGPGDALLIVDVQRDFLPGGALAVRDGDAVIAPLNRLIGHFATHALPVIASRDWHPEDHRSFHAQGGPWPAHCVAGSRGARFAATLNLPPSAHIVSKATRAHQEAYSAFEGTELGAMLRRLGIGRLFVGGLATDYCVAASCRDARAQGFEVVLLEDAVRAVDVTPGDGARALAELRTRGVVCIHTEEALATEEIPAG